MIIASLDPTSSHCLTFDLNISGSKEEPSDIRFVIEGMPDPKTGEEVQDVFTIICKAVRAKDSVSVYIPRLLNVFKSGSYKSRLEVVLENRLFVPLSEEIEIIEPVKVNVAKLPMAEEKKNADPEVTASITNVISEMLKQSKEKSKPTLPESEIKMTASQDQNPVQEKIEMDEKPKECFKIEAKVDDSWKSKGFQGFKNPFKKLDK